MNESHIKMYINTHINNMFYTHMVTVCGFIMHNSKGLYKGLCDGDAECQCTKLSRITERQATGSAFEDYLD